MPTLASVKLVAAFSLLLLAFVGGWRVESWRWSASETKMVEAQHKAYVAQVARANAADAKTLEVTRALHTRIAADRAKARKLPGGNAACLDPARLHIINSVGNSAASAR